MATLTAKDPWWPAKQPDSPSLPAGSEEDPGADEANAETFGGGDTDASAGPHSPTTPNSFHPRPGRDIYDNDSDEGSGRYGAGTVDREMVLTSLDELIDRPASAPPSLLRAELSAHGGSEPFIADIRLHPAYEGFYRSANDPTLPPPLSLMNSSPLHPSNTHTTMGATPLENSVTGAPHRGPGGPFASGPGGELSPLPPNRSDADVVRSFFHPQPTGEAPEPRSPGVSAPFPRRPVAPVAQPSGPQASPNPPHTILRRSVDTGVKSPTPLSQAGPVGSPGLRSSVSGGHLPSQPSPLVPLTNAFSGLSLAPPGYEPGPMGVGYGPGLFKSPSAGGPGPFGGGPFAARPLPSQIPIVSASPGSLYSTGNGNGAITATSTTIPGHSSPNSVLALGRSVSIPNGMPSTLRRSGGSPLGPQGPQGLPFGRDSPYQRRGPGVLLGPLDGSVPSASEVWGSNFAPPAHQAPHPSQHSPGHQQHHPSNQPFGVHPSQHAPHHPSQHSPGHQQHLPPFHHSHPSQHASGPLVAPRPLGGRGGARGRDPQAHHPQSPARAMGGVVGHFGKQTLAQDPALSSSTEDLLTLASRQHMKASNSTPSSKGPDESLTGLGGSFTSLPPLASAKHSSPAQAPLSSSVCRYYAQGYCSRGEKCNFLHSNDPAMLKQLEAEIAQEAKESPQPPASGRRSPPRISSPSRYVNMTLDECVGQIYSMCKDQHGCRFLQKRLDEDGPETVQKIFVEVIEHIVELMSDPFGNYLCQKLIEHANADQRLAIVKGVGHHLVQISKNMHGTRAIQKTIEHLGANEENSIRLIRDALKGSVVGLIQDLNGNHVIQKCIHKMEPNDNQFIYDAVAHHCVQVATHRHGCCVMQRCIDHASDSQKLQLVTEVKNNALELVQDAFGNYVVQYVLDLGMEDICEMLAANLGGNLFYLSMQKFSSNVVEKCLKVGNIRTVQMMCAELAEFKQDPLNPILPNTTEIPLVQLLQHPYGNYVVQTALQESVTKAPHEWHLLVAKIKPYLPNLRSTPYVKRIQALLAPTKPHVHYQPPNVLY